MIGPGSDKKDPYWFCITRIVFNLLDIGGRPDLEVCTVYQKWFSAQFVTDPGPPPSWPAIFNNYSDDYLENYYLSCWELLEKLCSNLTKLRFIIWISSSVNEAFASERWKYWNYGQRNHQLWITDGGWETVQISVSSGNSKLEHGQDSLLYP